MKWKVESNGTFTLYEGTLPVLTAYAHASDAQGHSIITREAKLVCKTETEKGWELVFRGSGGLTLKEVLTVSGQFAFARCLLSSEDGGEVESNDLVPLVMWAKCFYPQ